MFYAFMELQIDTYNVIFVLGGVGMDYKVVVAFGTEGTQTITVYGVEATGVEENVMYFYDSEDNTIFIAPLTSIVYVEKA